MLIDLLRAELLAARKAKMSGSGNPYAVGLLTTLVGEATNIGKVGNGKTDVNRETTDDEVLSYLRKSVAGLTEMRGLVEKRVAEGTNTRDDELAQVDAELAIVQGFLDQHQPKQLSADELRAEIAKVEPKDIGSIMKHLKANHAGRYDGKLANQLAREAIA